VNSPGAFRKIEAVLPRFLRRHILDFEARIDDAVAALAARLPEGARVLDAGAGESRHAEFFARQRYVAVDLAVGDAGWDYSRLDALADLERLPLRDASCDGALNIVTLEHVREPGAVLAELGRVLKPGAELLLVVPHEWEVHQSPHDYFRYTRHGVRYLLERAGFEALEIAPAGGYFRLLSRRLLNGLQFFPGPLFVAAAVVVAIPALLLPALDGLDREKNFTLGYVCRARRPSRG
jgi:SAM-dependent methyltransferase